MGDQYVVGMMVIKNANAEIYQNDYIYSRSENYKYYNPVFVIILGIFYKFTRDIVSATQLLNSLLVLSFIPIFTILLNKISKKFYLSLYLVLISSISVVAVTEGELWGYFISYNASARGVYTILLLIVLYFFVYLKDKKNYYRLLVLLFSIIGIISAVHPPTGLSAGICCALFFFLYKLLNKSYLEYKWIILAFAAFCLSFIVSSVIPFTNNQNPFNADGMTLQKYYFIFEYVDSLSNNILKNALHYIINTIHPQIIILVYLTISSFLFILLKYGKLGREKYFLVSGLFNLPFLYYAISIPIIQTMYGFPIYPQILSFLGYIPIIIYIVFLWYNYNKLYSTAFILQLITTSLIISTFGLSLILTYYVEYVNKSMAIYVMSSMRGMRFFYIILPFLIINIYMMDKKELYSRMIIVTLPVLLVFQVLMQGKIYTLLPNIILDKLVGEKSREFRIKWEKDAFKKPYALEETAKWLKNITDKNCLILYLPLNYYMDSPKLKCLSERSFVIDQSSITQYSKNQERNSDYKQLVIGNINLEDYIIKYKPDFIVKDKEIDVIQNINYEIVFENDYYKIFKVNEKT